jgi:protein gp37
MAENTKIEWAHHTFNPWEGCQKVGPGCDHCYAEVRNARFNGGQAVNWGPGAPRRRTGEANWRMPLKWDAQAARLGIRYRVFCASLADVFDNEVDPQWRADLLALIHDTENLDWLLLTKRIGNAEKMLEAAILELRARGRVIKSWPWSNVWLGATIVNQEEADRDIPKLLRVPAAKRFLSCEPLLGPLRLNRLTALDYVESQEGAEVYPLRGIYAVPDCDWPGPKLDWVIVGGESGPGSRPMHLEWARSLRDQCQAAGVPFLFKQWGSFRPNGGADEAVGVPLVEIVRVGKKAAGRHLDGRTWDEVPA